MRIRKGILWLCLGNTWRALKSSLQINSQHAWQFVAFLLSWRSYLVHTAWFISVGREKCLFSCVLSSCIVMFWFWHVPLLWRILRYTFFFFLLRVIFWILYVSIGLPNTISPAAARLSLPVSLFCCHFFPALPWICVTLLWILWGQDIPGSCLLSIAPPDQPLHNCCPACQCDGPSTVQSFIPAFTGQIISGAGHNHFNNSPVIPCFYLQIYGTCS